MEATVLLCDFAEAINGKLYVMGGGWSNLNAPGRPVNVSLAIVVSVPWDRTNHRHRLTIELIDGEGQPVDMQGAPVAVESRFEVGRPPGVKPGTSLNAPITWAFNGLVLEEGLYEFKVSVGEDLVVSRPFTVQEPAASGF